MATIKVFRISKLRSKQRQFLNILLDESASSYYSKSYSENFIALAYSYNNPVAVDIESKRILSVTQQTVLSEFMFDKLETLPTNVTSSNFILKYWTIKEVYSKYFNKGLYMNFKKINVKNCGNDTYIVSFNGVHISGDHTTIFDYPNVIKIAEHINKND